MTDPPKPYAQYRDLYLCDPDKKPCKSLFCGNECFATFDKEAALCDVYGRPILIVSKEQREEYDQNGILFMTDMFEMLLSAAILRYSMGNPLSERLNNKLKQVFDEESK